MPPGIIKKSPQDSRTSDSLLITTSLSTQPQFQKKMSTRSASTIFARQNWIWIVFTGSGQPVILLCINVERAVQVVFSLFVDIGKAMITTVMISLFVKL